MKNLKLLPRGLSMIVAASLALSLCPGNIVSAKSKVTKELFDYRNLDEKFTARNEDYIFSLQDLENREEDRDAFYITSKEFNKKPGSVIVDTTTDEEGSEKYRYVISVPEIRENGEKTDRLDGYGVLEVFSYSCSEGWYEDWCATSTLIIFDKTLYRNYPIKVSATTINGGPYVYSNLPRLEYCYFSADYNTSDEVVALSNFDAKYSFDSFGDEWWQQRDLTGVNFTKTSIDFSSSQLNQLIRRTELCNLLCRDSVKSLYSDEMFDIKGLFNTFSGPLAGEFAIKGGLNGFDYIYNRDNPAVVLALKENQIYVGISARYPWKDVRADVDNDIIYTALVYEDKSENPELISLGGYQVITKDTLDELLCLLMNPEIIWSSINALDL